MTEIPENITEMSQKIAGARDALRSAVSKDAEAMYLAFESAKHASETIRTRDYDEFVADARKDCVSALEKIRVIERKYRPDQLANPSPKLQAVFEIRDKLNAAIDAMGQ